MELEPVENVIETARFLDGVGLDVVLGDNVGDSGVEVVEPVYKQARQGKRVSMSYRRQIGPGCWAALLLTSVTGDDGEGHTGEELEGLQEQAHAL